MEKLNCVLLVDDDETTNYINRLIFEEMEVCEEILVATNGQEAIELLSRRRENNSAFPDLILLDINMPVMNGFEFIEAYESSNLDKSSVIILMLTTSVNKKDTERAKHPIISSFLSKPLTVEMAASMLKTHFNIDRSG